MVHHTICITVHNLQDTTNDNSLPCACRKSFMLWMFLNLCIWSFVVSALSEYRIFSYLFLSPTKFLSNPKILVFKIYFSRFCESFTIRLIIQSKSLFRYLSVRTFHSFALFWKDKKFTAYEIGIRLFKRDNKRWRWSIPHILWINTAFRFFSVCHVCCAISSEQ